MTTKIELRWKALDPVPDKPIFQLLDAEHPLKFYIGREMRGEYLLLLVDSEKPPPLKDMRSVQIRSFERPDGQWALLLVLTQPELAGIFSLLCEDLVACSRHLLPGSLGAGFVGRRLINWRRLLEEGRASLLSLSEVRGLFGELWLLDRYFLGKLGTLDAVRAWVGPFGADQDFQTADDACEVKTIQPDAPAVSISSEMQLHSTTRALTLVVLSLSEGPDGKGISLNDLVAELRGKLANDADARDALDDRLAAAGYLVRNDYNAPTFRIVSAKLFLVNKDFPCILPASVPSGVLAVRYQIMLAACMPHEIECPFGTDKNER
jgi:hypothetical protein